MTFRCHKPDLLAEKYVTSQRDFSFLINLSWLVNRTIELCPSYQPLTALKISSSISIKRIMAVLSVMLFTEVGISRAPCILSLSPFALLLFFTREPILCIFSLSLFLYLPKSFPLIQMVFLNFIKQRFITDPKDFGCLFSIPMGFLKNILDDFLFCCFGSFFS
jgi:hypothetical protein